MSLPELLKRWSELEPERCKPFELSLVDGTWVRLDGVWSTAWVPERASDRATIQTATQEAISDRRWRWRVGTDGPGFEASITLDPDKAINWHDTYASRETPAEALLAAYVKALEWAREQADRHAAQVSE